MITNSQHFISLLQKLAKLVEHPDNLAFTLNESLKLLAAELGMLRGAITLISPGTGKIKIEASYGLNANEKDRGEYALGEGITGRVIAAGRPMFILDVSKEPLFLNRTGARDLNREKISFLCVPIRLCGQIVGALSIDQIGMATKELEDELLLLGIIASILGHAAYESSGKSDIHDKNARPEGFIGNSEAMQQVYDQIAIVGRTLTTILLQGESGTGKELAARAIHKASARADGPFISLNCAALPESLIESELFGHEKGAFTGAAQTRKGRFELANGGTLFLDEIGELTPFVQAKLLRILQERTFERLGGIHTIHTDARLITATNQNLLRMVEEGKFRRDLYYRLNVFPINLPPLRDRKEDIIPLASYFLNHFARINSKAPPNLSLEVMELLENYNWPGNIRELQNIMERAILLLGNFQFVMPQHLPDSLNDNKGTESTLIRQTEHLDENGKTLEDKIEYLEKICIINALKETKGRLNLAARKLGITQRILGCRMKKYSFDYKSFR